VVAYLAINAMITRNLMSPIIFCMLTGFQIRAARSYKNLYIKDVSLAIGMHKSTLTRLEAQTTNLAYINCNTRTSLLIKNFYESQKIIFPSNNSIGIRGTTQDFKNTSINKFQFKISRIATRLNRKNLGELIGLAESTIEGWETQQNPLLPIKCNDSNLENLLLTRDFFLDLGIIYPYHNIVELLEDPTVDVKKSV
jgi:DNA-binding XRE family transcriptional regulator